MCGIVGVYNYGNPGLPLQAETIARMRDTMAHRGPDDAGVYVTPDGRLGLGHRRLSILDLSSLGHQPMAIAGRPLLDRLQRRDLQFPRTAHGSGTKGSRFSSESDTEVLLAPFAEYGPGAPPTARHVCLGDLGRAGRATLAGPRPHRDQAALLHLPGRPLLFASEIKAILAYPGIPRAVHLPGLTITSRS